MSGVSIRRMRKSYGAVDGVTGIDLEIAEGELVVLLGPSGCGKTTTLRCVAGLEEITSGEILIDHEVVSTAENSVPPEKRQIGMVFQSYAIWPHMTVAQNVAFGLKMKNLSKPDIEARVHKALDVVGLLGYAERSATQLSGGQQQRVALARAIVLEPKILLFDEPLSNLDARLREHMRVELRQLQKRLGITAIYVTHDQQEAMAIADRIVLMNNGAIEQIGTAEEIYGQPASMFAAEFVGTTNVFSGTVFGDNGKIFVRTADNSSSIECPSSLGLVSGTSVDLVVRPEHIVLSRTNDGGPNAMKATITEWTFLGNMAEVHLSLGGHTLRAQISPPPKKVPAGEEMWLSIKPEHVVVLPQRSAVEKAA